MNAIRWSRRAIVGLVMCVALEAAHAENGTWTNLASGGLWSVTGNWLGGVVADGTGFAADFGKLDIASGLSVQLDGPRTLTSLTFGDTNTATVAGCWPAPTTPRSWPA